MEIASLQEELTLVKMRDAEAQGNINELRQRLDELNREWLLHDSRCKEAREGSVDTYDTHAHELLTLKMREGQLECENKVLSQNFMDIETQKHLLGNQLRRQDDETHRLRLELEQSQRRENELRTQMNEMKHHMHDGELRVSPVGHCSRSADLTVF